MPASLLQLNALHVYQNAFFVHISLNSLIQEAGIAVNIDTTSTSEYISLKIIFLCQLLWFVACVSFLYQSNVKHLIGFHRPDSRETHDGPNSRCHCEPFKMSP